MACEFCQKAGVMGLSREGLQPRPAGLALSPTISAAAFNVVRAGDSSARTVTGPDSPARIASKLTRQTRLHQARGRNIARCVHPVGCSSQPPAPVGTSSSDSVASGQFKKTHAPTPY